MPGKVVLRWKPGVDRDFDVYDETVVNAESNEKVQECPRCGCKFLVRDNEIIDVLEGGK